MKLVLYNDYQLGVIQNGNVVDAMAALGGMTFRRPHDLMDEVITNWDDIRPEDRSRHFRPGRRGPGQRAVAGARAQAHQAHLRRR